MAHINITNLIVLAIALPVAAALPALFPRLPVPGVVWEIIIGVIIGPQVMGLVRPAVTMNFLANFGMVT